MTTRLVQFSCKLPKLQQLPFIIIGKGSSYTITERRVPELIPALGSQPAGDVSRKPGGRLPLLSARPAVTLATRKRPISPCKSQRRSCDLNPGATAPESSRLTTRLPSHQLYYIKFICVYCSKITR